MIASLLSLGVSPGICGLQLGAVVLLLCRQPVPAKLAERVMQEPMGGAPAQDALMANGLAGKRVMKGGFWG
jgi:hypothetical protein